MRRFEFVQGTSAKFWMADVEGTSFVVMYGRLGTAGQRKEKAFPSAEAATRELDKKVAEKLREGYAEVGAPASAAAPEPAPGPASAAPEPALPPRPRASGIGPAQLKAAVQALGGLEATRGRRSWVLGRAARRARRALEPIRGFDPAADAALSAVIDAVMARVVAPGAADRLPLARALELLYELDAAAFARAVRETWKAAPPASPAAGALAELRRQLDELGDPELALRRAMTIGRGLVERP